MFNQLILDLNNLCPILKDSKNRATVTPSYDPDTAGGEAFDFFLASPALQYEPGK